MVRSFLAMLLALAAVHPVLAWELVQEETSIESARQGSDQSGLTSTIWQHSVSPHNESDRVGLHRYRNPSVPTIAAVFYLPGTNMNGALAVTDENHNLWLYLANRGITVYAMSYRTHFVSHEQVSIDFMKDWTMSAFVSDAAELVARVREFDSSPLYIAGFSRGVSYSYGLAGRAEFAGLIALDGGFKSPDPDGWDLAAALRQFDVRQDYASVLSRRGWQARNELMTLAARSPQSPATKERYETIGEELADTLHNAWGPGRLANTVDQLTPVTVLGQYFRNWDWYFPSIQNLEGRSLSSHRDDPHTALDDHFGRMRLPILWFGSSGMGAESILAGVYSAVRSGSPDVSLHVLNGYGHTDVLVASRAKEEVYSVIVRWISERVSREDQGDEQDERM
ncbi:MAG: hypothetical protein O2780_10140 [Proteobacteria bacterium]|nr:hypothetical protein [Pseudomonadota bacterium]MDA1301133.1 hypothetical protein [Pseudomonadota bacterium]